ncbi:MAG: ABC transporter permease [Bacteroidota bacterium]
MNSDTLHINLYSLACMATLFSGLTLALLLAFAKRADQKANLFLSLAVAVIVLKTGGLSNEFLPALGPLFYFYVRLQTRPDLRFRWIDLLHFSPLLVAYWMPAWLPFILVISYLYLSHQLIQRFYNGLLPVLMDKPRFAFRRLDRSLHLLGLLCVLSMLNDAFCFAIAFVLIVMASEVLLRSESSAQMSIPVTDRSDAKEKGRRLKEAVAANRLYEDAELTLATLAVKLAMHPHDLSRIINMGVQKNFSDFINEFRVREIARKIQDPAYDKFTLLGIAYQSGFNSKTTFNRVFKEMTGKTPAEYKKEVPYDKLAPRQQMRSVLLRSESQPHWFHGKINRNYMLRNYLKIARRNLISNKTSSLINIGGLAMGMAVAIMIGLWIWDELSANKNYQNYDRIAQVLQNNTTNGFTGTSSSLPFPAGYELRKSYADCFKYVVMATGPSAHILSAGDTKISFPGYFMSDEAPDILTLTMLQGNRRVLKSPSSILVSLSAAKALFGNTGAMGKIIKLDNKGSFIIGGVYADQPNNSSFRDLGFIAPWNYYIKAESWIAKVETNWDNNSFQVFVQLADKADITSVSGKIKNVVQKNVSPQMVKLHSALFLYPMGRWNLYSKFVNGVSVGGGIDYVKLLGIIGLFVLLLACINFMNLSTARSEKRAKEVGIRKSIGSLRGQLIIQFYSESLLIALLSFVFSIVLVLLLMPLFNDIAGKNLSILWGSPLFWLSSIGFTLFTGIIAGSYPALYLSSFQPVKVLKGTFKAGAAAAIPRQVLVVMQFTVSVVLIIGTIVVFKQIQFAKNRPVGYSRDGLINLAENTNDVHNNLYPLRAELLNTGAVSEIAESSSPVTGLNNGRADISWPGKDPSAAAAMGNVRVTTEYGKTVGWKFIEGRDFSNQYLTDSLAVVLNEAAIKYTGLKNAVGQVINVGPRNLRVIGVIKDMVMQSPYEPVQPTMFYITRDGFGILNIKINPNMSAHEALSKIDAVYKKYVPSIPFSYKFADDEYARKFVTEERVGKLAGFFALLAIFISCIGLFGMASFMAEQRTKEIGVRKVLGATVLGLWQLISKDFVKLTLISLVISIPVAYYFMHNWLKDFTYHADLSWWVFAATAFGTILITLLTVSYQGIKAALANPVKSLRSE